MLSLSQIRAISPGISLEWLMLKLKLQYFGHLMRRVDSLDYSDAGRDWGQEENRTTEDEMAGWHHWLDGLESEWTPGVGDGQGGLACCDSWSRKESDMTERLIWSDKLTWPLRQPDSNGMANELRGVPVWYSLHCVRPEPSLTVNQKLRKGFDPERLRLG